MAKAQKTHGDTAAKVVSIASTVEDLVDQLGPLEASLNTPDALLLKANEKRAASLRKLISDQVAGVPAATITVKGKRYTAILGPRENQTRIISMAKVWRLVKGPRFLEVCSLTLKALEQLVVDPAERAKLVKVDRTGPRSVQTFPIEQQPTSAANVA